MNIINNKLDHYIHRSYIKITREKNHQKNFYL